MNTFQEPYNEKYFQEIKRLKRLQKAEAYLEPKQTSTIKRFVNILNSLLFSQYKLHQRSSTPENIENIEIFKVKLRWSKSPRLLQRIAFLVFDCFC